MEIRQKSRDIKALHATNVLKAHAEEVRDTIPADRLLVYETCGGWELVGNFLDVGNRGDLCPRTNSTKQFQEDGAVSRQ